MRDLFTFLFFKFINLKFSIMNKKFLSVILFSALMVGTAGTFTSCKDYDDDIDQINNELTGIKASISDLQAKVGDGKFVTNVVKMVMVLQSLGVIILLAPLEPLKAIKGIRVMLLQSPSIQLLKISSSTTKIPVFALKVRME